MSSRDWTTADSVADMERVQAHKIELSPSVWDGVEYVTLGQHHGLSRSTVHVQALAAEGLVSLEIDGVDGHQYASLTPPQARRIADALVTAANCLERES